MRRRGSEEEEETTSRGSFVVRRPGAKISERYLCRCGRLHTDARARGRLPPSPDLDMHSFGLGIDGRPRIKVQRECVVDR